MQTKYKLHQKVRLLHSPDPEYVEYHTENAANPSEHPPIQKGSEGEVNLILPNGQYHVEIIGEDGEVYAYAKMDEESIEAIGPAPEKEKKAYDPLNHQDPTTADGEVE